MKKLTIFVLLLIQAVTSFTQDIEIYEKVNGSYNETTNLFEKNKYVKPGDTLVFRLLLIETTANKFQESTNEAFSLIADTDFFTSISGITYNKYGDSDTISFGSPSLVNNDTIAQTISISGEISTDSVEIVDVLVTIPSDIGEGSYEIKLEENFVIGLTSPTTVLTVIYQKGDISVQKLDDEYITANTIKVQKGQIISSKININEPDTYVDYYGISNEWNIDLNIPSGFDFIFTSESGDLEFINPNYMEEHFFDITNTITLITNNGETIHQGLNVTGGINRDQITIKNVHPHATARTMSLS